MTMNGHDYRATGHEFLARARTYLGEDDLLQASEKGWGAAAQMVKAAAATRGWRHNGHRELYLAIDGLVEETGDEELSGLFDSASALHSNFYVGWMTAGLVASSLTRVERFVEKLDALAP